MTDRRLPPIIRPPDPCERRGCDTPTHTKYCDAHALRGTTKPLTLCCAPGCNRLTPSRYCEQHPHNYDRQRPSVAERGYSGRPWQAIRRQILARDPWCVDCQIAPADSVDHIVPRANGGTDELENLRGLCKSCHSSRTARERVRG